jgi:DNA-directed RNA polymerase subunit RPC12/RpoP
VGEDDVIHFTCAYCGRKIRARDTQACRKAKCPACGHTVRVPRKQAPPVTAEAQGQPENAQTDREEQWEGKSDKEIAKLLLGKTLMPEERVQSAAQRVLAPLVPQYDDLTIFALSAAFLLLYLIGPGITVDLFQDYMNRQLEGTVVLRPARIGMLSVLAGVGMIASLVGVFFDWQKPRPVKLLMLSFAVLATGGIGIYAGLVTLRTTRGWLMMVFPLWNVINGAILLLMFGGSIMDAECVVDRRPRPSQIVVTLISISLLLAICRYAFNLHWAITYSICVCYTMSLNHTLQDLFGGHSEPLTTS